MLMSTAPERKIAMAKQATRLAHEPPAASSEIHPTHEEIAALAYAQWQENGCPQGKHEEHWLRAEQELLANREVAVLTHRIQVDSPGSDTDVLNDRRDGMAQLPRGSFRRYGCERAA